MATAMLDMSAVGMPVVIRLEEPVSDAALMEFSAANREFRVERNKDGEVTILSPVGGESGEVEAYLCTELTLWNREAGHGRTFSSSTGFRLPDGSCLSPDASWVSRERWDGLDRAERKCYPPLCPEFVVEVRSESDARSALEAKMALWMENGVQLGWLVDPIAGEVVVYRAGEAAETLERPEVVRGHGPVAGFELRCEEIWGER